MGVHSSRQDYERIDLQSSRQKWSARVDADDDQRYYGNRNESGERHGKGMYYFANGDYYSGNWRKGRMEGQGKYVHSARGIINIGWFYQNKCMEQPNRKLKMKIVSDLIPVHYSPDALEREDVDTNERYVGSYKKGRRHGEGAYYFPNGDFYKGNWRKGCMEGEGKRVCATGRIMNGWFYKDEYVGREPNERLRLKIRRGMIPGPGAAGSPCREGSIDSDSEDESNSKGAANLKRVYRRLTKNSAKKA